MKFRTPHLIGTSALMAGMLFFSACNPDETPQTTIVSDEDLRETVLLSAPGGAGIEFFQMPQSTDFNNIPADPRNPITAFKVQLGQMLYHETAIGRNPKVSTSYQQYSCASCHHAAAGFQACVAQGIGEGGIGFGKNGEGRKVNPTYDPALVDVQPIRSPSAMNAAWQELMLWNGQFGAVGDNVGTEASWTAGTPKENNFLGYYGLETQAIAGQNVHRLKVDQEWVESIPQYKAMFDAAFPEVPVPDRYSRITAGLAIAAYERTLMANQAPWQRWLRGASGAMTNQEKQGALLFFGKAGCGDCHTGPALNSMAFYGYGMGDLAFGYYGAINTSPDKPEHRGRGGFTNNPDDNYKFKVPQLYNLKDSPFYGHGSTFTDIRSVVAYKNLGIPEKSAVPTTQLASQFHPLGLTAEEVDAITAFLENALYDPNLKRYVPEHLPSYLCFPDADPQSSYDMGCN